MKRKSIILLSSILAGSLLVGGAFAAYAVTDNADPFGINVTPGNLDADDTDYVTLSWGSSTSLSGVGNIKTGENRKVGIVNLKTTNKAYPDGVFTITLKDTTTVSKGASDPYLINYLTVNMYEGKLSLKEDGSLPDVPSQTTLRTLPKWDGETAADKKGKGEEKSKVFSSVGGTTDGKEYTLFVTLDAGLSILDYTAMIKDVVNLKVDWGAKTGDEATDRLVYFVKPSTWPAAYAYAWNAENEVNNPWPGAQMAQHNGNVYKVSIPTTYTKVLFNNGEEGAANVKTGDLDIPNTNVCYDYTKETPSWGPIPAQKDYYLIGALNGAEWANVKDYKFEVNPQNPAEYVLEGVSLKANDELKVAYGSIVDNVLVVGDDGYFPAAADKKFKITETAEYTFYFSPTYKADWASDKSYGNQKGFEGYLWVVPPAEEQAVIPESDLVELTVTLHGFASDNAACFIHYWGAGTIGGDVLIKGGKAKVHKDFTGLLVVRMPAGAEAVDYGTAWNQSADVARDGTKTTLVESTETFGSFSWQ